MKKIPLFLQADEGMICLYMKHAYLFALVAAAAATGSLQAKEDAARLALGVEGDAKIEVISSEGGKLSPTEGVIFEVPTADDQWTTGKLTFKVTAETSLRIRLSATYTKTDDKWVFIDKIVAEGIQVENPDFEEGDGKVPLGWRFIAGKGGANASVENDSSRASSGETFVRVSHSCPILQTVRVPKDTTVSITFSARTAEPR